MPMQTECRLLCDFGFSSCCSLLAYVFSLCHILLGY
uniref:Uncharacterized protein n=1 Tax=Rhizophora mucronata TaxID=61149 RepID=A0A2P2J0P3_RHIMU